MHQYQVRNCQDLPEAIQDTQVRFVTCGSDGGQNWQKKKKNISSRASSSTTPLACNGHNNGATLLPEVGIRSYV